MRKYQNQLLVFFCITFLISVLPVMKFSGGTRLFIIQSSSMEPSIKNKSLIVVRPEKIYKQNDIITFVDQNSGNNKYLTTTHRLEMIINENGNIFYMTKGDGNSLSDENFVPYNQVIGKVIKVIPFFGRIIDMVKSPMGMFFLVFLPAFTIVLNETLNILDERRKKERFFNQSGRKERHNFCRKLWRIWDKWYKKNTT